MFSHDWPHNSRPINCHIISSYSITTDTLLPSPSTTTLLQPTTCPDAPRMARTRLTTHHIVQPMYYTLNMTQWGWKPAKQGHRRAEGEAGAQKGEQARRIRYACHLLSHFLLLNLHFHTLPTAPHWTQTHAQTGMYLAPTIPLACVTTQQGCFRPPLASKRKMGGLLIHCYPFGSRFNAKTSGKR